MRSINPTIIEAKNTAMANSPYASGTNVRIKTWRGLIAVAQSLKLFNKFNAAFITDHLLHLLVNRWPNQNMMMVEKMA